MPAATLRRISMKALTRYQLILLGEQRHITCEQLAQGCCPNSAAVGVEPATSRSRVQRSNHYTTEPPTTSRPLSQVSIYIVVISFRVILQGIPYAMPPVGKLRWRETVPLSNDPTNCPSELDASRYGSKCVQLDSSSALIGDEDCLFLNVWTPADIDVKTTRLSVMVHVHDGGLMTGSGHEPCKFISRSRH